MRDPYLYKDNNVLINLLGIKDQKELDAAEADYVSMRLRELATDPLPGPFDFKHLLRMHQYIFQDIYEWAGVIRKMNIEKEEPVLGGLSIEYSDVFDIQKDTERVLKKMNDRDWSSMNQSEHTEMFSRDLAELWKIHPFREGNTRTIITFCCQFADEHGFPIDRDIFEKNSRYVRTALVAYNAVFYDMGDLPIKAQELVKEWLALNRDELQIMWDTQKIGKLPPL